MDEPASEAQEPPAPAGTEPASGAQALRAPQASVELDTQAMDLQPAQGGFVEFTFDEAGLYPIVTHKFSNVGKGALGLFQAGEVDPSISGGH